MAFLETPRFPDDIAYGSKGGPTYKTSVLIQASGHEKRNSYWTQARHKYDVAYGVRTQAQLDALLTFFHSVRGRAHSFRFKDFSDFHTGTPGGHGDAGAPATAPTKDDYTFGTGDNVEVDFQISKPYVTGSLTSTRNITKPINGTILIALDTVLQTEGGGADYTIDYATGIVTFASSILVETLEYFSLKPRIMLIENCASGCFSRTISANCSSTKSPAVLSVIWSVSSGIVPCIRQRSIVPAPMSITRTSSSQLRP